MLLPARREETVLNIKKQRKTQTFNIATTQLSQYNVEMLSCKLVFNKSISKCYNFICKWYYFILNKID